jgi:HD-like signal output (HDOD) protein
VSQVLLQVISQKLPKMPPKVRSLLYALEQPQKYSIAEVAALVADCGNLEGIVLDMLNSGFFRTRRKARSAQDAFLLIGFSAARSVVLGVVLKGLFPKEELVQNFDRDFFLRHCIGTALASEMLAERMGADSRLNRYRLSTYGFAHDIGTLAMDYCAPITLSRIYAYAKRESVPVLQAERAVLGELTHSSIGDHVCRLWQLPGDITNVVAYHHAPRKAAEDEQAVAILYVGDIISWNYYERLLGNHDLRYAMDPTVLSSLGLTKADAQQVEDDLPQKVDEAMRFLTTDAIDFTLMV